MTKEPTKPTESESESSLFGMNFDDDSESGSSRSSSSSFFSFSSSSEYSGDGLWSEISLTSMSDEGTSKTEYTPFKVGDSSRKVTETISKSETIPLKPSKTLEVMPSVFESHTSQKINKNPVEFPNGIGRNPETYVCSICGEMFNNQAILDVHKLNHLATKSYTCEICNHASKNREDLALHHQTHEKNNGSLKVNLIKKEKFSTVPFRCGACCKTFQFASSFKRHMGRHALTHMCTVCNESFPTQLLCHQHKLTHARKKEHKCQVCGKDFHRAHQLNIHMAVHAAVKEYRCEECDTAYCYKTSLMRHMLKYHSPDAPKFQCHLCGELFKNKKMLNGHEILHTATKLIQCPDCTQTFKYRSSFHRHRVIHSSEKPFKCSTCGKQFRTESDMKTHKIQHIMNDEFVCKICDKSFAFEIFLNKHMLTHDGEPDTIQFNISD